MIKTESNKSLIILKASIVDMTEAFGGDDMVEAIAMHCLSSHDISILSGAWSAPSCLI